MEQRELLLPNQPPQDGHASYGSSKGKQCTQCGGALKGSNTNAGHRCECSPAHVSLVRVVCLNAHAFNYGLFYASVGVLLFPEEALRMFPEQHAVFLAVMLTLAGISQLIAPVAGYFSDRSTSSWGRRLPILVGGNAVLLCMVGLLYVARTQLLGWVYLTLLFFAITALNIAYTGFTGLVSDMIPQEQMGTASGIMGGLTALGAVVGLVSLGFIVPVSHAYAIYSVALIVTTPLTYWAARDPQLDPSRAKAFDWTEIGHSYYISPKSHGDFFWVFVSRTFYYMAVSVQIYILYYLKDNMPPDISDHAKSYTAVLCILSQAASGLVSVVAPYLADAIGRKPAIYLSCCVMALVYMGYCVAPGWDYVVALGIMYGMGNGVYISVDYALACECLPDSGADGAKDLALWGVAAFLGTMFGPCLTGPLLSWVGGEPGEGTHYAFVGYVAIMICGVIYSVGCGLALWNVTRGNSPRGSASQIP